MENNDEVIKPKSKIDEANEILERMEKVRDETKALVEKAEELKAIEILGGKSDAGQQQMPQKTNEELVKERCNMFLEGTGKQI